MTLNKLLNILGLAYYSLFSPQIWFSLTKLRTYDGEGGRPVPKQLHINYNVLTFSHGKQIRNLCLIVLIITDT